MVASEQRTEGVDDTLSRPGLLNGLLVSAVNWVERLNVKYSVLGNRPVFATAEFPWATRMEQEWHLVHTELHQLLTRKDELPGFHEIIGEVRSISTDRDWKTFLFIGFGAKSQEAARQCPQTWRILQTVPGLKTAMFSILEPGKETQTAPRPLQRGPSPPSRADRAGCSARHGCHPRRRRGQRLGGRKGADLRRLV